MERIRISYGKDKVGSASEALRRDLRRTRRSRIERQESMKFGKGGMKPWAAALACAFVMGLSLVYGVSPDEALKATPDHFDFGSIPEGEPAVATSVIENVGSVPVEITNVRTN